MPTARSCAEGGEAGYGRRFSDTLHAPVRGERASRFALALGCPPALASLATPPLLGAPRLAGGVRSSLAARAAALRSRQLAQVEALAQSASERMGVPTVALFLAFLVLIGYPAVANLAGS